MIKNKDVLSKTIREIEDFVKESNNKISENQAKLQELQDKHKVLVTEYEAASIRFKTTVEALTIEVNTTLDETRTMLENKLRKEGVLDHLKKELEEIE